MSAMSLLLPATWVVDSGPTSWAKRINTKPRISCPDTAELARDARLVTQLTVGVLSQNVPNASLLMRGAIMTMTATAKTSAANSRSEFVSFP